MPRTYDDAWVEEQLGDKPPKGYGLVMNEVFAFLLYGKDAAYAIAACYNYGFRRGRNYERRRGLKINIPHAKNS